MGAAFTFRAQPALERRRREQEQAERELTRAQRDRDAALEDVREADAALDRARAAAARAAQACGSAAEHEWYRFWIARLEHERAARMAVLEMREAALSAAADRARVARQRRESLERFKDKARRAFDQAQAATERRQLDELAHARFAARRRRT